MHDFHQALVNHGLGSIAVDAGYAHQAKGANEEQHMQQLLPPAVAPQGGKIQGMGIHINSAGCHEQKQLQQRMIDHMPHCARRSQRSMMAQDHGACKAGGNVSDLGKGGACQRPLQIDGKYRQHRTQQHGKQPQAQHDMPENLIFAHQIEGHCDHAEQARFSQHTGQKRTGRGRGHGMGLGQPDMQGSKAGFGAIAHQGKASGQHQGGISVIRPERRKGQIPDLMPHQEHAHQRHHTAGNGYPQISGRRPHGALGFLMGHPGIRGNGHDFKENKRSIQIVREEYAHHATQGDHGKTGVSAVIFSVIEIFLGKLGRHCPHEGGNQRIQAPEAIHPEG